MAKTECEQGDALKKRGFWRGERVFTGGETRMLCFDFQCLVRRDFVFEEDKRAQEWP